MENIEVEFVDSITQEPIGGKKYMNITNVHTVLKLYTEIGELMSHNDDLRRYGDEDFDVSFSDGTPVTDENVKEESERKEGRSKTIIVTLIPLDMSRLVIFNLPDPLPEGIVRTRDSGEKIDLTTYEDNENGLQKFRNDLEKIFMNYKAENPLFKPYSINTIEFESDDVLDLDHFRLQRGLFPDQGLSDIYVNLIRSTGSTSQMAHTIVSPPVSPDSRASRASRVHPVSPDSPDSPYSTDSPYSPYSPYSSASSASASPVPVSPDGGRSRRKRHKTKRRKTRRKTKRRRRTRR